jgi:hypothetical protein
MIGSTANNNIVIAATAKAAVFNVPSIAFGQYAFIVASERVVTNIGAVCCRFVALYFAA